MIITWQDINLMSENQKITDCLRESSSEKYNCADSVFVCVCVCVCVCVYVCVCVCVCVGGGGGVGCVA